MDKSLTDKYLPQDDVFLFNTGNARKAWLLLGCRYLPEIQMHRFVVWAPNAEAVSLVDSGGVSDSGDLRKLTRPIATRERKSHTDTPKHEHEGGNEGHHSASFSTTLQDTCRHP